MYLCVNDKSYNVTDNYNKPYMKVNGSILPLTTNGGGLIHCKDNNGNTYRPMTYGPVSSTWYTSAEVSDGMYDTTALTQEATTSTEYGTKATNSTFSSFSRSINYISSGYNSGTLITQSVLYSMYGNITSTVTSNPYGFWINGIGTISRLSSTTRSSTFNKQTNLSTDKNTFNNQTAQIILQYSFYTMNSTTFTTNYGGEYYTYDINNNITKITETSSTQLAASWKNYYTTNIIINFNTAVTTGTTYYTAESTYGYTGKSSSIQSGSSSWYTSAINSEGLLSTTALTRESTSGTSYLTVESTTGTSYETIESTRDMYISSRSSYRFTSNEYYKATTTSTIILQGKVTNFSLYGTSTSSFQTGNNYQQITTTYSIYWLSGINSSPISSSYSSTRNNTSRSNYGTLTYAIISKPFINNATSTNYWYGIGSHLRSSYISSSENNGVLYVTSKYTGNEKYYIDQDMIATSMSYHEIFVSFTSDTKIVSTTNTIYLTEESTTGTSYLTCESTSGYSGISSSSSIAYGWQ